MVHMGAITVDKRNHLIGNAFQQPDLNFDQEQSPIKQKPAEMTKPAASDLEQELLNLRRQNELILKQIERQVKHNNMSPKQEADSDYSEEQFDEHSDDPQAVDPPKFSLTLKEDNSPKLSQQDNDYYKNLEDSHLLN